jgi:hypothetical protein
MHYFRKSLVIGLMISLGLAVMFAHRAGAQSDVGIISGTPLKIQIFQDNSLQVWHNKYTEGATFGTAGSGFFIALNTNIYGPFYAAMEFVDQTPTTGQGTRANPFRSVLRQRITSGDTTLEVTQTALYVNNTQSFQLEWLIANTGRANACFKAYHAADLYFANDDHGIGYYNARTGSVGGYNRAKDWYMVFTPVNPASHYEEAGYRTIWNRLQNLEDLNDTINNEYIDNGAALQWDLCLGGGQSKTISDVWSFGESEGAIVAAADQAAGGTSSGPLGLSAQSYRPVAPGSPALTTTIPTPLDISLAPEVVGANMLWAAVATILFTIASEVFNRTLADYEAFFQRLFRPLKPIGDWRKTVGLAERLGRPVWYERLKLALIIIIYGLTFSFLDNTWEPFSLNGIWLFITMAIAFGVVGLADDIAQWNTARRWKLPTRISIRPGNLLLALFSMLFSRTLVLTPGVMFGMPEAFEIEPEALNDQRKNRLLMLAAGVLLAILLGSWLPTILSALALQAGTGLPQQVQSILLPLVSALQSLLLLIFAVTVQNLFLHMLALPETIGEMIKRWNRVAWFFALLLASYVFLQTLLNPNGDLARSLQTSNIRAFIGTIALFLLFVVITRGLLSRAKPLEAVKPVPTPGAEGYVPPQTNVLSEASSQSGAPQPSVRGIEQPPAWNVSPPLPAPNLTVDVGNLLAGWGTATQDERMAHLQRVAAHGRPALALLISYLNSPDPAIRLAAVGAVGSLGDRSCLPAVQPLLNDADPTVVQTAQWAAGVLQGRQ